MKIFRGLQSFKRQIVLTYTAGFFLLIGVFAAYLVRTESSYLYRDSYNEAAGLAESLAASSASWVLADDVVGLQEVIRAFQSHPEMRYAMVLSPTGRVLAHSDAAKVGLFVSDPQSLALIKAPPEEQTFMDSASAIDIAVPIMAGVRHIAWARVALGRKRIIDKLHRMIVSSALFMLLASVLAFISAWAIANRLGYRVGSLVQVLEEVQAGNFNARADIEGRDDEITKLANGLNRMLDALAQSEGLRQRARALEIANKELEGFSYSVSHNLNIPLRAIDGYSRILQSEHADKLGDEGKRLLNVVRNNTVRMGNLIDDILRFTRTGRQGMRISEVRMEELARDTLAEVRLATGASNLQADIGHLPSVMGDFSMLREVFKNILSNAIKFSRLKQAPEIQVGGYIEGDEAIYFVKDNGIGFDMKYANNLFGVFQRLHGVEEFEGTGIGLAIVKRIAGRHGGRVWAESVLNEGTSIYFALPARDAVIVEAAKNNGPSGALS
jgi:signal transduction histidine kinase